MFRFFEPGSSNDAMVLSSDSGIMSMEPISQGVAVTDTGSLVHGASVRSGKCGVSLVILLIGDSERSVY